MVCIDDESLMVCDVCDIYIRSFLVYMHDIIDYFGVFFVTLRFIICTFCCFSIIIVTGKRFFTLLSI